MRFERKYRIEGFRRSEVAQWVRNHPLGFSTAFPDRQVNNIYLDTPDFEFYQENVMGAEERAKYRIRWYGEALFQISNPQLEIKFKQAELGGKKTMPLGELNWKSPMDVRFWVAQNLREHGALMPTLLNRYDRSYWLSADGRFRITLDWQQRFHSMEYPFMENPHYIEDDALILEVKYEAEDDKDWQKVSRRLPFRVSKNSKYVNGLQLTGIV